LANTSAKELAEDLLARAVAGRAGLESDFDLLAGMALGADPALARVASEALFSVLVEGLGDRFEPRLCEVYAELFARLLARACPDLDAQALVDRYRRLRRPRACHGSPRTVFVLSRVTLGADVAVTSVLLDAAKRRFPEARIVFAGPPKNHALFAADPRIEHLAISYQRAGDLRERLAVWAPLRAAVASPGAIVIDPDSRLTQLGLLPMAPEEDYYFFESRSYGGDGDQPLTSLAARWARETLGVEACAYLAPGDGPSAATTVSLGVGDNPRKRLADPFEWDLIHHLATRHPDLLVDRGGGAEEAARVERAVAGLTPAVQLWDGAFAPFASAISRSRLYVGYDSAGGHVAAACGVPLVSVFAGFPAPRMLSRWRPSGPGPVEVVQVDQPDPALAFEQTRAAIERVSQR
jgi:hypothetical protein